MIKQSEIKNLSRQNKVPISTIERDYAQNWLLKYLPEMAFKGGTCIRKVYFKEYRFSDDLDFTVLEEINITKLEEIILNSVQQAKIKSNIQFIDEINSKEVRNGYSFDIFFRITRTTGSPLKIKIDITKNENEQIINQITQKVINHPYSDIIDTKVFTYSLDEIFAEKTRSLFERTRPRDVYDVWYLSKHIKFDTTLFHKKCKIKKLKPDIKEFTNRKTKFENAWEASLKHQLPELPSATYVFDETIEILKKII
jgi:predicted nucleotidyltransferase component of viral defense system